MQMTKNDESFTRIVPSTVVLVKRKRFDRNDIAYMDDQL